MEIFIYKQLANCRLNIEIGILHEFSNHDLLAIRNYSSKNLTDILIILIKSLFKICLTHKRYGSQAKR